MFIPEVHSRDGEQSAGGGEHNVDGVAAANLLAGGCGNHIGVAY